MTFCSSGVIVLSSTSQLLGAGGAVEVVGWMATAADELELAVSFATALPVAAFGAGCVAGGLHAPVGLMYLSSG